MIGDLKVGDWVRFVTIMSAEKLKKESKEF